MKTLTKLLKPRRPASRVIQDAADEAERKYTRFASHARDCAKCKAAPDPESAENSLLCFEGLTLREIWGRAEVRHAALVVEAGSPERPPRRRPF